VHHTSTTWPLLRRAWRLGVSILTAEQEAIGRQVASKRTDRFADLSWRVTGDDAVLLDGASGWLDVSVSDQARAGDHDLVVLSVQDLDADHDVSPRVFHASRFRRLLDA
jgi:flavin reductase (DIM6/NTAB) family NADH-FMN oxidoreductase RutF